MLLGAREVAGHQVGLARVFVGATMSRVQLERAPVVLERVVELAEIPVGETEIVLQIRVVRVPERGLAEASSGFGPVFAIERVLARRVVRVALGGSWFRFARVGE